MENQLNIMVEKMSAMNAYSQEMLKQAQAASVAKSTFLSSMSHEIRTPLNAIIGMSNIAKTSIDNKEKAVNSINESLKASMHLLGILNNILDMSKIEAGKLELDNALFNIAKSFEEISSIIRQKCDEKNIKFSTNVSQVGDICVIGDKLRLNQTIVNLLGNSVKFTPSDGEISFLLENMAEDAGSVALKFTVKDNGIGMNDEQLRKLFTAFEQTDKTVAARFGGTGLGLAISQNIVNMMGGRISAISREGQGSEFSFEIKFKKGEICAKDLAPQYANLDLTGKRLLIVEDVEINRIILTEFLSSTNAEIDEAENGAQAVEKFTAAKQDYYDFIFMDVQMPQMNGYEATAAIRNLSRTDAKNVPIVAMTANAYKEDVERALQSGMNGHLAKPIDKNAVMKILAKYLAK
jgi:CheY-like chemotaxis protein